LILPSTFGMTALLVAEDWKYCCAVPLKQSLLTFYNTMTYYFSMIFQ